MKSTAIVTAMIALFVAIGMTGSAMAAPAPGSTMNYDMTYSGTGIGSMEISTISPVGSDYQLAKWNNCVAGGYQKGDYNGGQWLKVDRKTTITGVQHNGFASGSILTQTRGIDPAPNDVNINGGYVYTYATYRDGVAGGSYIMVDQDTTMRDNGNGYEKIDANTRIDGFAFGTLGRVTGLVAGTTDGTSNASTGVAVEVHDGKLNYLNVDTVIVDKVNNKETSDTKFNAYVTAPGSTADGFISGYAAIDGVTSSSMQAVFTNAASVYVYDHPAGTAHFYAVTP